MQKLLALAAVLAHLSEVEKNLLIAWAGRPMPEAVSKQASAIRRAIDKADEELDSLLNRIAGPVPGRWGFYVFGLEVGSRNPGDPVGLALRRCGLWPW